MEDKELSVQDEKKPVDFDSQDRSERKLMRSKNRMLLGVCGGIAEFFRVDATLIRLLVVFFALAGIGAGIVAYLIAAVIMPRSPDYK